MVTRGISAAALLLLGSTAAEAHTGVGAAGLAHPFVGIDHLIAMLAVGVWAGQRQDAGRWLMPLGFVLVMAAGALAAVVGVAVPAIELGILASLALLGLLVASGRVVPLPVAMALVAAFALLHGHAHGAESPAGSDALAFGAGFLAATIMLLGVGFTLARMLMPRLPWAPRVLGGAVLASGLLLAVI